MEKYNLILDELKEIQTRLSIAAIAAGNKEVYGDAAQLLSDELMMLQDAVERCCMLLEAVAEGTDEMTDGGGYDAGDKK